MRINILGEQIDAYEQRSCSFSDLLREEVLDNYMTKRPFRIYEKALQNVKCIEAMLHLQ